MDFEWDEAKNRTNLAKHGIGFELVHNVRWDSAIIEPDLRFDYGEDRYIARAYLENGTGVYIAFTLRAAKLRIITMRTFNKRDYQRYAPPL